MVADTGGLGISLTTLWDILVEAFSNFFIGGNKRGRSAPIFLPEGSLSVGRCGCHCLIGGSVMPPSDLIPVPTWSISSCHNWMGACADLLYLFIHHLSSVLVNGLRRDEMYCQL